MPEPEFEAADGVRFVSGESDAPGLTWTGEGSEADDVENLRGESICGQEFYLSFVRYEDDLEVESVPESEYVDIGL